MKILFYYRDSENIGIEYLSAVLKRKGHKTELRDGLKIRNGSF